jgi:hypothetical protein
MTEQSQKFQARCEARAQLWQLGELDLPEAVDALQAWAQHIGLIEEIGQDAVQQIMATAFAAVRDDLPKALPGEPHDCVAQSTLNAAAWLWFQVGDEARFARFLKSRSAQRDVIMKYIKKIEAKRNAKNGG